MPPSAASRSGFPPGPLGQRGGCRRFAYRAHRPSIVFRGRRSGTDRIDVVPNRIVQPAVSRQTRNRVLPNRQIPRDHPLGRRRSRQPGKTRLPPQAGRQKLSAGEPWPAPGLLDHRPPGHQIWGIRTKTTQRYRAGLGEVQYSLRLQNPYNKVVRVAFIAESFLPSINGVTNSVLRMLEHLRQRGHQAMVIASTDPRGVPTSHAGFPIRTTASLTLPWYPDMRMSTTFSLQIERMLADFCPDVVHLAAPVVLGWKGITATARLGLPSVALYQTEVPQYAAQYGYPAAESLLWRHLRNVHNLATINLAPSSFTRDELIDRGFARVAVWGRGVDTERFNPDQRDQQLHNNWAPDGQVVVGYMGRLGPEKQVNDLATLADLPGIQLVIIGDGPQRAELAEQLPGAIFTGMLTGPQLPRALASLDLFVHPGELETFCQAIQEAQASGLPTIAPRRGGPIDLIDPSHNGWLYVPGDLADLRSRVADLAGDSYKRAAFGRTARLRTELRTWPALCDQLLGHYENAIELGVRSTARIP